MKPTNHFIFFTPLYHQVQSLRPWSRRAWGVQCLGLGWQIFKNYHTNYFSQDFHDLKVPKSVRQSDEFEMLHIPSGKYPKNHVKSNFIYSRPHNSLRAVSVTFIGILIQQGQKMSVLGLILRWAMTCILLILEQNRTLSPFSETEFLHFGTFKSTF